MSPPTTLITFRIRAPRSTRTLKLYGSWDNFTTSYPMSKDLQAGSEYWSGCFNFSNIICDGKPSDTMRSRDGGLKMGGTYWYHYKIDDESDFHNVCERATTNCPLLPGQLVNVLYVPYVFSGNRSRNPSTSSSSSERRTMDPEDRFMNPRPAPAKPELARMNTSPVLNTLDGDDHSLNDTVPHATRFLRLPKKGSIDSYATNSPNGALAGGLRAAFRMRTARSQSPESKHHNTTTDHQRAVSTERETAPLKDDLDVNCVKAPERDLLLRAASENTAPALSFEQHRRQKSQTREQSRLQNAISADNLNAMQKEISVKAPPAILHTVKEVVSDFSDVADMLPFNDDSLSNTLDLEKRLPTLPNTPSSAYPTSLNEQSPCRRLPIDIKQLESHFSTTTIDTDVNPLSMVINERSRFSAWTSTTGTSSAFVDNSIPILEEEHDWYDGDQENCRSAPNAGVLPSTMSFSSICSSNCTTPSTTFVDTDTDFESARFPARYALAEESMPQVQHYRLPECEYSSQTTLKAPASEPARGRSGNPAFVDIGRDNGNRSQKDGIMHSKSMQKLLDELSYLSNMIQR